MLDPIVAFFQRIFSAIGRGIGMVIAWILWPFVKVANWYRARGWIIKGPIGIVLLLLIGFYSYFVWQTQVWSGFDPDYVNRYNLGQRQQDAGTATTTTPAAGEVAEPAPRTCVRSAIVDVTADLIDFNVNQNAWISSMLLYKLGLFGLDWDKTPWFDNKASFQRGVNQVVRRTAVELVDSLGRVRGTSGINADLQRARGNLQFDEETWYFGSDSLLPKTPTPNYYRTAMADLRKFNASLEACDAIFDGRSDNLIELLDRLANDLGATTAILRERSEFYNNGWFDTRADDRFWFAYGQLYAQYGILSAAGADFEAVIRARGIEPLWTSTISQLRSALRIQPAIISNGREDGWIMPTHLATIGFYMLRVRSNFVEIRDVLAR
ncbi:DUF2333 family protein [Shinella zoogloeoides]|jgi:hypothetical protein|uniref:DUF2333 family protein n=1 Tax=Shinella zoogloeoides TaxID=352475 RepID=A0A6N8THY1_SHIZO|nr:DUF2333 family protein [Shinella zoogloeoides]MXO02261.1 DUF2333 family protein [Shinella zoogloeoides]UEX80303.1 DUF2333 family protein [Shinella zoogloeoides]